MLNGPTGFCSGKFLAKGQIQRIAPTVHEERLARVPPYQKKIAAKGGTATKPWVFLRGGTHTFLHQKGVMTDLGLLGAFETNNFALSINNVGQVPVQCFHLTAAGTALLFERKSRVSNLKSLRIKSKSRWNIQIACPKTTVHVELF